MEYISKSFTAVGNGAAISVNHDGYLVYSVSGTFSGTVILEKSLNGGASWEQIVSKTAAASDSLQLDNKGQNALVRFRCSAFTSGTIVTSIFSRTAKEQEILIPAGSYGVVGSGFASGWNAPSAAETFNAIELPAAQTDAEVIITFPALKVGTKILGLYLNGRFESAGNAASFTASVAKADLSSAAIVGETNVHLNSLSLSASADTLISKSNSLIAINEVVSPTESMHVYILGTTAASTKIFISSAVLLVEEA